MDGEQGTAVEGSEDFSGDFAEDGGVEVEEAGAEEQGDDESHQPDPRRARERWESSEARRLREELSREREQSRVMAGMLKFLNENGGLPQPSQEQPERTERKSLSDDELAELQASDPQAWLRYNLETVLDQRLQPLSALVSALQDRAQQEQVSGQHAAVVRGMKMQIEEYEASEEGQGISERATAAARGIGQSFAEAGVEPAEAQVMVRDLFLGLFVRAQKLGINYGVALDALTRGLGGQPAAPKGPRRVNGGRSLGGAPTGSLGDSMDRDREDGVNFEGLIAVGGEMTEEQVDRAIAMAPGRTPIEKLKNFHAAYDRRANASGRRRAQR